LYFWKKVFLQAKKLVELEQLTACLPAGPCYDATTHEELAMLYRHHLSVTFLYNFHKVQHSFAYAHYFTLKIVQKVRDAYHT